MGSPSSAGFVLTGTYPSIPDVLALLAAEKHGRSDNLWGTCGMLFISPMKSKQAINRKRLMAW